MLFYDRALRCRDIRHFTGFARSGLNFGQPEVEDLGMSTLGHKNIRWLDVAEEYPFSVCDIHGVGKPAAQRQDALQLHGMGGNQVLEGRPVKKLHDEKRSSIFRAYVVNGADLNILYITPIFI